MLSEEKEDLIEGLIDEIKNMRGDPLEYTGNKLVISRGNSKAKLLIIGEAPGPIENEEGEPFRGPAGILLDEMLESEKFKLDQDIYIILLTRCFACHQVKMEKSSVRQVLK